MQLLRAWAAPALLALVALVAGMIALPVWSAAGGAGATAATRAPVFSLRRAPRFASALAADVRLQQALDRALDGGSATSCLVVDDGARPVYRREARRPLVPASNMKLLTAVAALRKLGGEFRY